MTYNPDLMQPSRLAVETVRLMPSRTISGLAV